MTAPPPERLHLDRFASPLGEIRLTTDERGVLRALWFADESRHDPPRWLRSRHEKVPIEGGKAPAAILRALDAYFAGELAAQGTIPWAVAGTPFQRRVWEALTRIPAGTTLTYGALAASIGQPAAVRAVGAANGANPISIVIPCHRLIGASGALTDYGGGLERKRWLLAHEGVPLPLSGDGRLP